MNKWMKKLLWLWVFGLCLAFANPTQVKAAGVPQITLTVPDKATLKTQNMEAKLSVTSNTLSESDFTDDKKLPTSLDTTKLKTYITGGKYITAGNIEADLGEQNKMLAAMVYYSDAACKDASKTNDWVGEKALIKATITGDASLAWVNKSYMSGRYGSAYQFDFVNPNPTLQAYSGLWLILSWNEDKYLIHYTASLKSSGHLVCSLSGDNMIKWTTSGVISNYQYWGNYADGEVFCQNYTSYEDTMAKKSKSFEIYLAKGASVVEDSWPAGSATYTKPAAGKYNGTFNLTESLPFMDAPFTFKVKNAAGMVKTYTVSAQMPWGLSFAGLTVNGVWVNDEPATPVSSNSWEIPAGADVRIQFPAAENQKLIKFEPSFNNPSVEKKFSAELGLSTVSFKMPKSKISVGTQDVEYKDTTERPIRVSMKLNTGEDLTGKGPSVVIRKGDTVVETAQEGETVTVTAAGFSGDTRAYHYVFDHWEIEGQELSETDKKNESVQITMPSHEVSITAVYKKSGISVTMGIQGANGVSLQLMGDKANIFFYITDASMTDTLRTGVFFLKVSGLDTEAYRLVGWKNADGEFWNQDVNTDAITWMDEGQYKIPRLNLSENSEPITLIAQIEAKSARIVNVETADESKGTVTAKRNNETYQSGSVCYDGDSLTLTAIPKTGYRLKTWEAEDLTGFADASKVETTYKVPSGTETLNIRAVFEVDPAYLSPDCELTKVELLKKDDGTVVKQANKNGTTFTIKLSAKDMSLEEAENLTGGAYMLRLTYPETAIAKMDGGFGDHENGDDRWLTGITNGIGKGRKETFTITAENGTNKNTYTIAIEYDDRPTLTAGTVKRVSDTEASVGFRSSSAGTYYWAVVDAGEAKPDIPTNGAGTTFKYADRENTIKLTSLTAGAKDLYIVVKNDDDSTNVKISDVLKISIPAFGGAETTYKVNVTGSLPGGKLTVDKKEAKAGETVTVTVTPDSGKKMTTNSLIYSQSSAPYEVVHIDEKTKQFIMPAYELSVSCRFEDENSSTTPETTTGKIGAFVVNGVSGTVDNTTGTITVTLPNGTDLTSLAPVITISGAKSISPASGATVNLSSPVTYTLTLEDGTTKTYTVRAYVEGPSKSDQLWNDMLNNVDGSPDHSGSKTWWKKAKDLKKHNDYPEYW